MRLRVLRLTPHFYYPQPATTGGWPVRYDPIGGMQSQIFAQTLQLSRQGVEQTVLTLGLPNAPSEWRLDERTVVRGVGLPMLPLRSELRGTVGLNVAWAGGVALWSLLRGWKGRFDIVHSHGSGVLWPLAIAPPIARALGARLVLTVHCSALATYEPMSSLDQRLRPLALGCESWAVRAADHVVALTERTRRELATHAGLPPDRLSVIPDAIDPLAFSASASPSAVAQFARRHLIPAHKRVISYVGRLGIEKGWPAFVGAAAQLADPSLHFLVCGDGNQRRRLDAAIVEAGLRGCFSVTGFVPREQVACALALSSLFVLPSNHEEFGSSVLEARAMGVPVIATRVGGIPEHVRDGVDGILVPPKSPHALAATIRWALDHPDEMARMARRGAEVLDQRFRLEAAALRLKRIYERTVGMTAEVARS